jgi:hypothetical protein
MQTPVARAADRVHRANGRHHHGVDVAAHVQRTLDEAEIDDADNDIHVPDRGVARHL